MSPAPASPNSDPDPVPDPGPGPVPPPRRGRLRRLREWFVGLSEAGKVALVAAVITTVGGGAFGVATAATTVMGGSGDGDGRPQKAAAAETPGAGRPTSAAKCTVRSGFLYCTGDDRVVKLYRQRDEKSERVFKLTNTSLRYSCWGRGHLDSEGNDIWYWTDRDSGPYWGNAPAADVHTDQHPAPGLPECK